MEKGARLSGCWRICSKMIHEAFLQTASSVERVSYPSAGAQELELLLPGRGLVRGQTTSPFANCFQIMQIKIMFLAWSLKENLSSSLWNSAIRCLYLDFALCEKKLSTGHPFGDFPRQCSHTFTSSMSLWCQLGLVSRSWLEGSTDGFTLYILNLLLLIRLFHTWICSYVNRALGLCSQNDENELDGKMEPVAREESTDLGWIHQGWILPQRQPWGTAVCETLTWPPLSAANCDLSHLPQNFTLKAGSLRMIGFRRLLWNCYPLGVYPELHPQHTNPPSPSHLTGLPWGLRWWRICLQRGRSAYNPWVGKIRWRRAWPPTPVFWPGDSHEQRILVGYGPWDCKASDTTEWLSIAQHSPLIGAKRPGHNSNVVSPVDRPK